MTNLIAIHPKNPQRRLVCEVARQMQDGALIAYPTQTTYALGCLMQATTAQQKLRTVRGLSKTHALTLMCEDIAQAARYAVIANPVFRFIKSEGEVPITYILPVLSHAPKALKQSKRREVGIRFAAHPFVHCLLDVLGEPFLTSTLQLPGMETPLQEAHVIRDELGASIGCVVDSGTPGVSCTGIVSFEKDGTPCWVREP